jgi:hypothetical protein
MIFDDIKTRAEAFRGTSLHLNSYLVSATPNFQFRKSTTSVYHGKERDSGNQDQRKIAFGRIHLYQIQKQP